jgi:hypothetical protein
MRFVNGIGITTADGIEQIDVPAVEKRFSPAWHSR